MAKVDRILYESKAFSPFVRIGQMAARFREKHPDRPLIAMGGGDVSLPLVPPVIEALYRAVDDQSKQETFHGYTGNVPELVEGILKVDYADRGVTIGPHELMISCGSSIDIYYITDLFSPDTRVLIPDPVYPAYWQANDVLGREITYLPCQRENDFNPIPPDFGADLVYLCSPCNPTGGVMTRDQLASWVAWAKRHDAVIIMDSAYESFIRDETIPKSIYEIEGAKECAVEIRSFSKTAGFTGMRCSYIVIPDGVTLEAGEGRVSLREMYIKKRDARPYVHPSYVVQMGAAAYYSPEGQAACRANTDYYLANCRMGRALFDEGGVDCVGGYHSPYLWMKCPAGLGSWAFLDLLMDRCGVLMVPGAGFGPRGDGWMRVSCFGKTEDVREGITRTVALCRELEGR